MNTIRFTTDDPHKTVDRVEIMSNGWVKAVNEAAVHSEEWQYPPHRVKEISGEVDYYE